MFTNISEFKGKVGIAIKLADTKLVGETLNSWESYIDHTFPKTPIIITTLSDNSSKTLFLQYWNDETMRIMTAYVPKTMQVKQLKKSKSAMLALESYHKSLLDNLDKRLGHYMYIGSDPEIFIEDNNKQVIPAFNFLGSKANSNCISTHQHGENSIYWDGFQAEFDTYPHTCLSWQVDSVQAALKALLKKAKDHNKDAKLSMQTVMDIPFDLLQSSNEEHVQFGCMPSFNVYGLKGRQANGREVPFRSAGGHIHFGIGKKDQKTIDEIVKSLDAILGVACVSLFAKFDNPKRRQLYGIAGEYRLPAHGLEYRVLSNAWLTHPLIMNLVFDLSRKVVVFGEKGLLKHWKSTEDETISVIQNCDVQKSREILNRNKDTLLKMLKACYSYLDKKGLEVIFNIFYNGLESVIKDPHDLESNWELNGIWKSHSDGKDKNLRLAYDSIISGKKVA